MEQNVQEMLENKKAIILVIVAGQVYRMTPIDYFNSLEELKEMEKEWRK